MRTPEIYAGGVSTSVRSGAISARPLFGFPRGTRSYWLELLPPPPPPPPPNAPDGSVPPVPPPDPDAPPASPVEAPDWAAELMAPGSALGTAAMTAAAIEASAAGTAWETAPATAAAWFGTAAATAAATCGAAEGTAFATAAATAVAAEGAAWAATAATRAANSGDGLNAVAAAAIAAASLGLLADICCTACSSALEFCSLPKALPKLSAMDWALAGSWPSLMAISCAELFCWFKFCAAAGERLIAAMARANANFEREVFMVFEILPSLKGSFHAKASRFTPQAARSERSDGY